MNFTYRRKRQRLIIKNKSSFSGRLVFSSAEKCHSILVFLLLMGSDMSLSLLCDNSLCVCVYLWCGSVSELIAVGWFWQKLSDSHRQMLLFRWRSLHKTWLLEHDCLLWLGSLCSVVPGECFTLAAVKAYMIGVIQSQIIDAFISVSIFMSMSLMWRKFFFFSKHSSRRVLALFFCSFFETRRDKTSVRDKASTLPVSGGNILVQQS